MSHELAEETLVEGRTALYQLERHLKDRGITFDNASESSSHKNSAASERRLLDQLPRMTRLNNRLESLGLTVEELDDRGLLDGGGSVPSYYTSLKQKNRRVLELQPRSHRLQERGKETSSKLLNATFHMLRVLIKRGLRLEDYLRSMDTDNTGYIHKKQMIFVLKQIGLPFTNKELQDISQQYAQPASERIDYLAFLRDGRLHKKGASSEGNSQVIADDGDRLRDLQNLDLSTYTVVLHEVKRMLFEAIKTLHKNFDDVYRMFARWDTQGTGTVTATQFLRVLARLHIELSDQDQDFVVELLDTNGMGRIDFESLLTYCFHAESPSNQLNTTSMVGTAIGFDDTAGDILSAVSIDGNSIEQKSTNSNNLLLRRPHTASMSRPYTSNSNTAVNSTTAQQPLPALSKLPAISFADHRSASIQGMTGTTQSSMASEEKKRGDRNRPSTAVGKVSSSTAHQYQDRSPAGSRHPPETTDEIPVVDLPDDVIHGEEMYLSNQNYSSPSANPSGYYYQAANVPQSRMSEEGGSRFPPHTVKYNQLFSANINEGVLPETINDNPVTTGVTDYNLLNNDPIDHLILLANQILATLRDIILTRYRRGRSLREIYLHFDRDNKGYFTPSDFMMAAADLSIETSERVAMIAVKQIGIDSYNYVTYGEFVVFILDSDHGLLESNLQDQMASLFEKQGHEYQSWMIEIFQQEEGELMNGHHSKGGLLSPTSMPPLPSGTPFSFPDSGTRPQQEPMQGFIRKNAFIAALKKMGVVLTSSEMSRIVDRFDIYGNDYCSIERFLRMIQTSRAWKHAELVLAYQDQAIVEANQIRQQQRQQQSQQPLVINEIEMTEEVINMCEYLGICILSEQNMIWIAADALRAPLPINWSVQKDNHGKTYFYNHLTNSSQWEHPLDPHFRNLRDKYRQSSEEVPGGDRINSSNNTAIATNHRLPAVADPYQSYSEGSHHLPPPSNTPPANKQAFLFNRSHNPPPRSQVTETEAQVFDYYREQPPLNYSGRPKEIEVGGAKGKTRESDRLPLRPSSAAIPEKINISFGNTTATNGHPNQFNDTMVSGLTTTVDYSKQPGGSHRPVSAPAVAAPTSSAASKKTGVTLPSTQKASAIPPPVSTAQSKVIIEAVYGAPYLKTGSTPSYQDTTKLSDRQYYNQTYHQIPPMVNSQNYREDLPMQPNTATHFLPTATNTTNTNHTVSNSHSKARPASSSSNNKSSTHTAPTISAVDRALSIGKASQQILQERDQLFGAKGTSNNSNPNHPRNRTAKLNEMLEGNVIEKLDYLLTNNSGSNNNSNNVRR